MPTPNANGPDISHWNTITGVPRDSFWTLFSHKVSEGGVSGDPMFRARWSWAQQEGFRYRGAYHWLRTDSSMKAQADNFVRRVAGVEFGARGDIAQLDYETTPNIAVPTSTQAAEWADRINQTIGRQIVITYLGTWLPDSPLDPDTTPEAVEWRQENPTAPLWLAYYNTALAGGWKAASDWRADVWQWTSNYRHPSIVTPKADGTFRGFDMNHVFDFATLDHLANLTPPPPPPPPPPEEDDMTAKIIIRDGVLRGDFLADGTPLSAEARDELVLHQGFVIVPQDHPEWRETTLDKMGGSAAFEYGKRAAATP